MVKTGPQPKDKYIPWYFVAFFLVIAVMDGIFVYLATGSHTGVIEENHYQRGLQYNERVAAVDAQEALGWTSDIRFSSDQTALFELSDKDGAPITGAVVEAQFLRPVQDGHDFVVNLGEMQPGLYASQEIVAEPGLWEIRVFVKWKQQQYQTSKRIVVNKK